MAADTKAIPHEWAPSPYGHGERACIHCKATNREIAVIGDPNHCPDRAALAPKGDENDPPST